MITIEKMEKIGHDLPQERTNPAPGFVCLYTGPNGEHCIIGEVCSKLGLEVPKLNDEDNKVAIGYLAIKGRWAGLFTPESIVWAAQAQLLGQMGYPWKVCVQSADNSIAPKIDLHHTEKEKAILEATKTLVVEAELVKNTPPEVNYFLLLCYDRS